MSVQAVRMALVAATAMVATCAGGSVNPAEAATCAELKEQVVPILQAMLDYAEDIPLEDLMSDPHYDALVSHDPDRWEEIDSLGQEWEKRRRELGCLYDVFEAVAEARDELKLRTRSAEYLLEVYLGETD